MYTSLKAHIENGQVILDEPLTVKGNVKAIVTILETQKSSVKNGKGLAAILKEIAQKQHSYSTIDVVEWQKEVRKDRELPRNA